MEKAESSLTPPEGMSPGFWKSYKEYLDNPGYDEFTRARLLAELAKEAQTPLDKERLASVLPFKNSQQADSTAA